MTIMQPSQAITKKEEELIELARRALQHAHAPYSDFKVGAALLTEDNQTFVGCNVENTSFGLTVCAERNAVYAAVVHGNTRFRKLVVVVDDEHPSLPCGACRQVLFEFSPNLEVLAVGNTDQMTRTTLAALLPEAFHYKPSKRP
jgi:cytidine deaminase